MPASNLQSYKVTANELSSSTKFDNFVQAVQDDLNNIDNAKVATAAAIAVSKLAAGNNGDILQTVSGAPTWRPIPMARAKRTTAQSITTATWTLLLFDGEDFDNDTIHDTATNTGRLTCKTAGKYVFELMLEIASNTTGIRACQVQKNSEALPLNGAGNQGGFAIPALSTAVTQYQTTTGLVDMAVNDYLAAVFYQDSGGALNIGTPSYFAMHRVD